MEPNLHRKSSLKTAVYRFQVFYATENILEEDGLEAESVNNVCHTNNQGKKIQQMHSLMKYKALTITTTSQIKNRTSPQKPLRTYPHQ